MSFVDIHHTGTIELKTRQFTPPKRIAVLLTMLTYKRPHGSDCEKGFISRFIKPLGAEADDFGNYWYEVGEDNKILWSCHTDTVHRTSGIQKIIYGDDIVTSTSGECLGADDTAGCWVMLQMAQRRVPGVYCWHRGEECGGLGSRYNATFNKNRFVGIKAAIALDRKGTRDIITHQMMGRCASDAFGRSLAGLLNTPNPRNPYEFEFKLSNGGTFTDTANYTELVGECTNLAVGYESQHTAREMLDVRFLDKLCNQLCAMDQSKLVFSREPGEEDPDDKGWGNYGGYSGSGYGYMDNFASTHWQRGLHRFAGDQKYPRLTRDTPTVLGPTKNYSPMEEFIMDNPEMVAEFIESMGFELKDLEAYLG